MWVQQAFPNAWQTHFRVPSPAPQANATVTSTTTCDNKPPTFSPSGNRTTYSSYRPRFARGRPSNNSARQRTPYRYGNTPSNNYPRRSQNDNGNFFANSPQYPQYPQTPSSSTQNFPQFNQRSRFIPRQHIMHINKPHVSIRNQSNGTKQETINAVTECKKPKRKLKSQQSEELQHAQKPWNHEDSVKAIAVEEKFRRPKNNQIMIKFPDHEITQEIVQNFHTDIKSVHFQAPTYPRCCYVDVQPSANIKNVANALNETFFQHEKLKVEIRENDFEENTSPENIDPYTLFIGNLTPDITSNAVKNVFPKAIHVVIGVAKRTKYVRHAFLKFSNVEDAIQAYKQNYNLVLDNRSVVLRFRRARRNVSPPGQVVKLPNEMNEFDVQKIKKEPTEENIDEYNPPPINVSRVVKPEMMEEDEYEDDSKYESIPYENDINIKSECPDYENEYDEQYYEEEDTDVSYTFRRNETRVKDEFGECNQKPDDKEQFDVPYSFVSKNQVLSENNEATTLPKIRVKDEFKQLNQKPDDINQFDVPYLFVPKNQVLSENNKDITLPKTDEINDGGSNKEDQSQNNLSNDDNDDDGGAEYNWGGLNEQKKSEKQTKGVDQHGQKYGKEEIQN